MNIGFRLAYPTLTGSNSTRALELAPDLGNHQEALKGRLIEIDLDNPPEFEAVSYVWGQRKTTGKIICKSPNGAEEEITITGNGADLLRRFRYRDKSRLLWVDAICINQKDLIERSEQVSIMSHIYAKAQCVLVWLPNDDADKWARFEPVALRRWFTGEPSSSRAMYFGIKKEFQHIGSSSWFKRVWTILEYAFARDCKVYFSQAEPISAIELSKMDGVLLAFPAQPTSFLTQIPDNPFSRSTLRGKVREGVMFSASSSQDTSSGYGIPVTLDIIIDSRSQEASIELDHVFALYSIFETKGDIVNRLQKPSYTKSKEQVFWDTTVAISKEHGIRFLANLPGIKPSAMHDAYPSWVPDLSIPGRRIMLNAFALSPRRPLFSVDNRQLLINGLLLHESVVSLTAATNPWTSPSISQRITLNSQERKLQGDSLEFEVKAWHVFLLWYDMVIRFMNSTTPNSKLFYDFFACMSNDEGTTEFGLRAFLPAIKPFLLLFVEPMPCETLEKDSDQFSCFRSLEPGDRLSYAIHVANLIKNSSRIRSDLEEEVLNPGPLSGTLGVPQDRHAATQYLEYILVDREFFITKDSYMGLTNGYVEEGDLLALLPGLWMPMLLRRDSRKEGYKYVGLASVKNLEPSIEQIMYGKLEPNPTTLGHELWNKAIESEEYIALL
jgi:hypothetical protein